MGNTGDSRAYQTPFRDRPLSVVRIRKAAGRPNQGWLMTGAHTLPVALGRGGIKANTNSKATAAHHAGYFIRSDCGGGATGTHGRARTLPTQAIRPTDAWSEDPADRHYNQAIVRGIRGWRRPADAGRSSLRFHRRDRPQHRPRVAGRGSAVFLHLARENFSPTAGCVGLTRNAMLRLLERIGPQTKIVIGVRRVNFLVIASEAKQSRATKRDWIASSQVLLAMTMKPRVRHLYRRPKIADPTLICVAPS